MRPDPRQLSVVVFERDRLRSELVREMLAGEPDIVVLAEVGNGAELGPTVARLRPDFVVVGLVDAELPEECRRLVSPSTTTRVLALSGEGRHGVLYELLPRRVALGEMSPEALVRAMREAVVLA